MHQIECGKVEKFDADFKMATLNQGLPRNLQLNLVCMCMCGCMLVSNLCETFRAVLLVVS